MSDRWVVSRPEYYVQTGGMHENPFGVPKDEIIKMILELDAETAAQVVFGKYVESSGLVFTSELVQKMFDRSQSRVLGNFFKDDAAVERAHLERRRWGLTGSPFFGGIDLARKTDYTVITVLDTLTTPARVVYYKRLNRVPWESIYAEIGRAVHLFGPNFLADSTGMGGDVVMDALESRQYCPLHHRTSLVGGRCMRDGQILDCDPLNYISLGCVEGYNFSGTTKVELIEHTRNMLSVGYDSFNPEGDFGWIRCPPIVQLEEEFAFYAWDDKKLVTDALFSLCLAIWHGLEDPVGDIARGSIYGS